MSLRFFSLLCQASNGTQKGTELLNGVSEIKRESFQKLKKVIVESSKSVEKLPITMNYLEALRFNPEFDFKTYEDLLNRICRKGDWNFCNEISLIADIFKENQILNPIQVETISAIRENLKNGKNKSLITEILVSNRVKSEGSELPITHLTGGGGLWKRRLKGVEMRSRDVLDKEGYKDAGKLRAQNYLKKSKSP